MRKSVTVIVLAAMVTLISVVAISESTQDASNPARVAYVDIQKVLQSTKDFTDLNSRLQEDTAFYQTQLDNLTTEFKSLQEAGASAEELSTRQDELLSKKTQYEQTLQNTYNAKLQIILESISKRIKDYSTFNGYDMIVNKEDVVYGNSAYDLTDKIIEYLKVFQK